MSLECLVFEKCKVTSLIQHGDIRLRLFSAQCSAGCEFIADTIELSTHTHTHMHMTTHKGINGARKDERLERNKVNTEGRRKMDECVKEDGDTHSLSLTSLILLSLYLYTHSNSRAAFPPMDWELKCQGV